MAWTTWNMHRDSFLILGEPDEPDRHPDQVSGLKVMLPGAWVVPLPRGWVHVSTDGEQMWVKEVK